MTRFLTQRSTVLFILVALFTADFSTADDAVLRVNAAKPARKTLVRRTEQPGQIEAFAQTPVFAKVAGYVDKVLVDIGDQVRGPNVAEKEKPVVAGQVLAEISVPELQQELAQKKSLVEAARSDVQQAAAAVRVAEAAKNAAEAFVVEVAATKARAEAERMRCQLEVERLASLLASKAITTKAVDEAKSRLQAALAGLGEVAAKTKSAEAGVAQKIAAVELAIAEHAAALAKVKVAEADLARVETLVGYTTIRAPFDGTITTRNIDVGHFVQPAKNQLDQPLFVVVQAATVRVFAEIPEADSPLVQPGNEASVRVPALGNPAFPGKVARTSWTLNQTTRTLKAEIDLPNPDGQLRPGMYVYADVKVAERKDAISLPKAAVLSQDTRHACFIVNAENKIVRQPITVGIRSGDDFEITSGLTGDEKVILTNASSYREGQQVEIVSMK